MKRSILANPRFIVVSTILLLSNLLQVLWILKPEAHIDSDMRGYIERGIRLAQGLPFERFDHFFPPGTSYCFALIFLIFGAGAAGLKAVAILQAVCLTLAAIFTALIAGKLFKSTSIVSRTLILTLCYWPFMATGSFYMSEPLFSALFLGGELALFSALSSSTITPINRKQNRLLVISAIFFSFATLVRAQGLAGIAMLLIASSYSTRASSIVARLRLSCLSFVVFAIPLILHMAFASYRSGDVVRFLAANDGFNFYIGQSRREAVGALDIEDGTFFIFHNNNAGFQIPFLPPEIIPISVLDRQYFFDRTWQLVKSDPFRQLLIMFSNATELFSIEKSWPIAVYEPKFAVVDRIFQELGRVIIMLPALIILFLIRDRYALLRRALLLIVPIVGAALISMITTGQPRYLLPFLYNLFPLALAFWTYSWSFLCNPTLRTGRRNIVFLSSLVFSGTVIVLYNQLSTKGSSRLAERINREREAIYQATENENYKLNTPAKFDLAFLPSVSSAGMRASAANSEFSVTVYGDKQIKTIAAGLVAVDRSGIDGSGNTQALEIFSLDSVITAEFPPGSISEVAICFVDSDSEWRTGYLLTEKEVGILSGLRSEQCKFLNLSGRESKTGVVNIRVRRLTGSSLELSRVMLRKIGYEDKLEGPSS